MSMKRAGKIDSGTASPKTVSTQEKNVAARTKAILARDVNAPKTQKERVASRAGGKALVAQSAKNYATKMKRSGPAASPVAKKKNSLPMAKKK